MDAYLTYFGDVAFGWFPDNITIGKASLEDIPSMFEFDPTTEDALAICVDDHRPSSSECDAMFTSLREQCFSRVIFGAIGYKFEKGRGKAW